MRRKEWQVRVHAVLSFHAPVPGSVSIQGRSTSWQERVGNWFPPSSSDPGFRPGVALPPSRGWVLASSSTVQVGSEGCLFPPVPSRHVGGCWHPARPSRWDPRGVFFPLSPPPPRGSRGSTWEGVAAAAESPPEGNPGGERNRGPFRSRIRPLLSPRATNPIGRDFSRSPCLDPTNPSPNPLPFFQPG